MQSTAHLQSTNMLQVQPCTITFLIYFSITPWIKSDLRLLTLFGFKIASIRLKLSWDALGPCCLAETLADQSLKASLDFLNSLRK